MPGEFESLERAGVNEAIGRANPSRHSRRLHACGVKSVPKRPATQFILTRGASPRRTCSPNTPAFGRVTAQEIFKKPCRIKRRGSGVIHWELMRWRSVLPSFTCRMARGFCRFPKTERVVCFRSIALFTGTCLVRIRPVSFYPACIRDYRYCAAQIPIENPAACPEYAPE